MTSVYHILEKKGFDVYTISPDQPIYEALKIMADKSIGALIVTEDKEVKGIITERDYSRKVILQGRSSKNSPIRDIMTEQVLCVNKDQTVEEIMAVMSTKRIRHIPVLENNELIGIISIGDVVNALIEKKNLEINQLVNYITDGKIGIKE